MERSPLTAQVAYAPDATSLADGVDIVIAGDDYAT
jgi:hypothetical protein